ncbi:MAG: creatininase family protein [Flavobacteriaceae bacterium]|nr:creatininase family protein [Flavobacteriaceae bacterium]
MKAFLSFLILLLFSPIFGQELPVRWDELTASDWPEALEKSNRTIILPIGILEKHGMHAPLGSDLIHAREWSLRAARQEYAVVFPDYFYGQIYEAKHQPGTFSLPPKLVWEMLQATCDEMHRNGFEKIIIVNGHGGNPNLLRYFAQSQLEKNKGYVVYFYDPQTDDAFAKEIAASRKSDASYDMHGGERETSSLLYLRPELVKLDRASQESGKNQNRLNLPNLYTGIWWYASFPNHYAGQAETATAAFGKLITEHQIETLVKAIKTVKSDSKSLPLQNAFFEDSKH